MRGTPHQIVFLLTLSATLGVRASAQTGEPLVVKTLDQAVQLALTRNPSIQLAVQRSEKTSQTVAQILAGRGPSLSATVSYSRLFNAASAFGGGATGGASLQNPFAVGLQTTPPGSVPIQLSNSSTGTTRAEPTDTTTTTPTTTTTTTNSFSAGTDLNQSNVRLALSQGIDITGVIRSSVKLGDVEKSLQELEVQRTAQETVLSVKNSVFSLLRAQALVAVAEASVAQSQEQLRVAEVQLAQGTVAQFDVLRAKTQLANNQQSLISARNQVRIAKTSLANTIGIDPNTPIELGPSDTAPALPNLDPEALLTIALKQRPEALSTALNASKAKLNTRIARRTIEPSLAAGVSGTYNPKPAAFQNENLTGAFGLTLSVPIWDSGSTKGAVASARADERSAEIQQEQFLRGIKTEVEQAVVAVKDAHERAETAAASVEQAREAFRLAGVRFRAGVDTQLAVNDAQTALTQAETNLVNGRYDYLNALARLSRVLGEPVR